MDANELPGEGLRPIKLVQQRLENASEVFVDVRVGHSQDVKAQLFKTACTVMVACQFLRRGVSAAVDFDDHLSV